MGAEQSSPTAVPPQRRAAQPSSTASSAAAAAAVSSRSPLSESAAPRAPGGAPILSEPDVELQPLSTASKPPSPATVAAAAAVSPSTVPAISQASASGPVPQPPQPALVAAPSTLPTSSSSSHSPPAQPRRSTPASLSLPSSSVAQQPASSVSAVPAVLPLASVPAPLPVVAVSSSSSAVLSSSSSTVRPAAPSPSQPLVPVTSVPQPANAVLHPLGEQPIEEKKQEEAGKQPGPEALVEAKEEVANERPAAQQLQQGEAERSKQRSTGGSGFWRFVLCGCGTAATDPPQQSSATARPQPPPQPAPPVAPASAPTVPAVLPVVSDPVVQQPQQSAAIPQAAAVQQPRPAAPVAPVNVQQPRPQPGPSPSPGQPASVVVSSSVPVAKGAIPIAAPAKHASATSATAASPPPVVQPSQPTVSAASLPAVVDTVSPGDSAHDSDEPVRLMHPVYSHLPLLNIPAAALSLYPPHRPPVPDPTEQRAFALQRQLPPPKSLAAPFLLTSLTDPFIPSSTSDSAFQSTADWSYAQLLDILHACRQTREKFFDNSYPPSHESLFAHFEPKFDTQQSQLYTEVSGQRAENGVRWCRASEMQKPTFTSYFSSWRVMNDVIAASDVRQGGLGTCYAVASMCSLVDRYPHFVRSLFLTHDYSPEGVYQIRLCRDGVWRVLTIDDFLPCLTDSNWFRFTHAVDAQLWPALLEKAYSKMYGSYKALESGLPTEVLSDLTGSPSFRVDMHPTHATAVGKVGGAASTGPSRSAPLSFVDEQGELDVLWLQMLEWKSRGYIFCASCDFSHRRRTHGNRQFQYATSEEAAYDSDEAWQTNYARLGLVTSHAYSVLDVVEAEGGVRLIKLRNPWGRFVWHGEWSRGPQTKEQKEREQAEERKRAETKVAEQKRREETARKPEPKTWKELMKSALSSVADSVSDASSSASAYYPASRNANTAGGAAIAREDKGLFWMTWNDFTLHFSTVRGSTHVRLLSVSKVPISDFDRRPARLSVSVSAVRVSVRIAPGCEVAGIAHVRLVRPACVPTGRAACHTRYRSYCLHAILLVRLTTLSFRHCRTFHAHSSIHVRAARLCTHPRLPHPVTARQARRTPHTHTRARLSTPRPTSATVNQRVLCTVRRQVLLRPCSLPTHRLQATVRRPPGDAGGTSAFHHIALPAAA